jgi:hypothetical protein
MHSPALRPPLGIPLPDAYSYRRNVYRLGMGRRCDGSGITGEGSEAVGESVYEGAEWGCVGDESGCSV